MAVLYNKVQRRNPSDPNLTPKWYPALRNIGMMKGTRNASRMGKSDLVQLITWKWHIENPPPVAMECTAQRHNPCKANMLPKPVL